MAHLVKDLDDLQIRWSYEGKSRVAELLSIDPDTGEIESVKLSAKVADMLVEHGISSGS